jgi:hypothetical protein
MNRHKARRLDRQPPPPLGVTPLPDQAAADVMPPRDGSKPGTGINLGQDPELVLRPPAPTPLHPIDDLHSACPYRHP